MLVVLVIIVLVSGLLALFFTLSGKEGSGWVQFYAKGKDSGFSFKEIELLRQVAVKCNLDEPAALFWSQEQLDQCIRSLVRGMYFSGGDTELSKHDFLSKLYDFRKKVEMQKPRIKSGISNSRQISDGQNVRVLVEGSGVFKSQVIKNTSRYLTISRPTSSKISATFSWQGLKISVYFWRSDDAGYVFDSDVQDEVFSKGLPALKISHSDALFRTQKRKSIRAKVHKPAFMYPVINEEQINVIETDPGLKCFLEDLSDTGCAVTVGGKASTDVRVKIQFAISNSPISMCGTIRSVEYKADADKSILHIEADSMPIEVRNKILGEVFGMLPEDEEELPFRMLEQEADELSAEPLVSQGNSAGEGLDSMRTSL